ncbi:unnamed protein product [Ceratitis capitata]|uniref:(Mediterranean fruit fly) hypothetical protein n=1 Tax=Ceratitis capitata TaxID=7213 RepID=A0A811UJI2_CERCA|nr:unnamed protein product [Ceratitis capitata]
MGRKLHAVMKTDRLLLERLLIFKLWRFCIWTYIYNHVKHSSYNNSSWLSPYICTLSNFTQAKRSNLGGIR